MNIVNQPQVLRLMAAGGGPFLARRYRKHTPATR